MSEKIQGSCLCGKVAYSLNNKFSNFYFCHCQQCQKISGSAHAANLVTSPDNIEWLSGQQYLKRFEYPGRDFTKVFCSECGSGLPFVNQSGKSLVIPAGSLDQEANQKVAHNIFWNERASWYEDGVKAPACSGYAD
jgi:hypothetical protein